ncbi:hypothetical protein ACQUSR_22650 [Streptomyces sp. P1-3]
MADLIARIVARLLCAVLFPDNGKHRAAPASEPALAPDPQPGARCRNT